MTIQRMMRRKREKEMQNSSEGGHEEKINPETGCFKFREKMKAQGENESKVKSRSR